VFPLDEKIKAQKLKWARLAADQMACESVIAFLLTMTRDGEPFRARLLKIVT
jgi:hypothetical protein